MAIAQAYRSRAPGCSKRLWRFLRGAGGRDGRERMSWNWWEQPYLRFRKYLGLPFSIKEATLEGLVRVQEIVMQREPWMMPPIYNERTGEVEKLTYVRGVPGTEQHGLCWIFPAWRCQSCKAAFIAGRFEDLRHECMWERA
jgi:hypothetical protein